MAALSSSQNIKSKTESTLKTLSPSSSCVYTKCYCEENVWYLCKTVLENHCEELIKSYAVFISNADRKIPLWKQRASKRPDQLVVWDYHVIFIHHSANESLVYDLDSTLPFPNSFEEYAMNTFRSEEQLRPQFHRLFRVIPASTYLETFASDRSHMLDKDNHWHSPPPDYPCISTDDCSNNLPSFIDMSKELGEGTVMNLNEFFENFSS